MFGNREGVASCLAANNAQVSLVFYRPERCYL